MEKFKNGVKFALNKGEIREFLNAYFNNSLISGYPAWNTPKKLIDFDYEKVKNYFEEDYSYQNLLDYFTKIDEEVEILAKFINNEIFFQTKAKRRKNIFIQDINHFIFNNLENILLLHYLLKEDIWLEIKYKNLNLLEYAKKVNQEDFVIGYLEKYDFPSNAKDIA